MPAETARQALGRAVRNALIAAPTPLWGNKVYFNRAPSTAARPYAIWMITGGGAINRRRIDDGNFTISVVCVADNTDQALQGAALIAERLDDKGEQEPNGTLEAGTAWIITTCTQERVISTPEYVSETETIYREGAVYRLIMEAL